MASVATSSVRAGGEQCDGQGVGAGLKRRRDKGILRLKRRVRTYYRGVLVAVCMGLCVLALVYRVSNDAGRHSRNSRSGARQGEGLLRRGRPAREALDLPTDTRRLAGNLTLLPVCDPGNYPGEIFTWEQKKQGAVVLYIVGVLYMFVALAIVCDEFFVPALERIVDVCAISDDVGK